MRRCTSVTHESDDFDVEGPIATCSHREVRSDDVRAKVELPSEGLVDDGDTRCAFAIGAREVASRQQRNAHRAEIIEIDPRHRDGGVGVG